MMIDGFAWLRPLWLLALPPLVPTLVWLARRSRPAETWRQICDPHLLPLLAVPAPAAARRLPLVLLAIAWLLAVGALAGPSLPAVAGLSRASSPGTVGATTARRDLGPWLVLPLLPLGAAAFRRGWL